MTLDKIKLYKFVLVFVIVFTTLFAILTKIVHNPTEYQKKEFSSANYDLNDDKDRRINRIDNSEKEERVDYNIKIKDKIFEKEQQ